MIDTFSLALSHALLFYVAVRIMLRPDLDSEEADDDKDDKWKFGRRA
jgi:hypothetical protein